MKKTKTCPWCGTTDGVRTRRRTGENYCDACRFKDPVEKKKHNAMCLKNYYENIEDRRKSMKAWYKNNKAYFRAYAKAYYAKRKALREVR